MVGRCLSYGEGITYWALAEVIRRAVGIGEDDSLAERRGKLDAVVAADPDGAAIARQLSQLVGLDPVDEPGEQSAWAVRRLLELLAADGPVIVVFDDLHWAETSFSTSSSTSPAGRGPGADRLHGALRAARAPPEWERLCPTTIALRPLAARETDELVDRLVGDALAPAVRGRLVELAAGNPLFVEQVLQMLVEEGRLVAGEDGWRAAPNGGEITVPPTIEATLAARVDHLTGPERACAECAAVIGMEFWAAPIDELLAEASERPLETLRRKLVIEPVRRPGARVDMLRFRHLLLRDAVYEAIPKRRRAELHERVASWMESWFADRLGEVEEIVGYHYEAAANYSAALLSGRDESGRLSALAVGYLTSCGRRAAARQDDLQAARRSSPGSRRCSARTTRPGSSRCSSSAPRSSAAATPSGAEEVLGDARRAAATARDPRLDAEVRILEVNLRRLTSPRWWAANGRTEAAELTRIFAGLGDDAGVGEGLAPGRQGALRPRRAGRGPGGVRARARVRAQGRRVRRRGLDPLLATAGLGVRPDPVPRRSRALPRRPRVGARAPQPLARGQRADADGGDARAQRQGRRGPGRVRRGALGVRGPRAALAPLLHADLDRGGRAAGLRSARRRGRAAAGLRVLQAGRRRPHQRDDRADARRVARPAGEARRGDRALRGGGAAGRARRPRRPGEVAACEGGGDDGRRATTAPPSASSARRSRSPRRPTRSSSTPTRSPPSPTR